MATDPNTGPANSTTTRRTAVVVFLIALGARGTWLSVDHQHLAADPDSYRTLAETLSTRGVLGRVTDKGHVVPTAFRPPGYPVVLAALASRGRVPNWRIAVLHLACGVLTALGTLWLGSRWNLGMAATFAALIVTGDPLLVHQSSLVMTETVATLLAVAALLAFDLYRTDERLRYAAAAGILLGAAGLCRPVFLVFAAAAALTLLATERRAAVALFVAGVAILVTPWITRNQWQLGKPLATTTHGGYTLLLGNNPSFYAYLRDQRRTSVWKASELELPVVDLKSPVERELALDRACYDRAWQSIRAEPGMFAYASAYRVAQLWSIIPHRTEDRTGMGASVLRWGVAGWYACVWLLALVGIVTTIRDLTGPKYRWGLLLCGVLTLVHLFYWSNMRMRAPAAPYLALGAAVGLAAIARRISTRKRKSLIDLE